MKTKNGIRKGRTNRGKPSKQQGSRHKIEGPILGYLPE
jgi:hypothetical protein